MKIVIGSDEAGFQLKKEMITFLKTNGFSIEDLGCYDTEPVLYPDVACKVGMAIKTGEAKKGILICGTGIGMAMTANKVPGIRAAQCHDTFSAERAALSNNSHIITLGARVVGIELAKKIVMTWLDLEFKDGRSTVKINRIKEIEESFQK